MRIFQRNAMRLLGIVCCLTMITQLEAECRIWGAVANNYGNFDEYPYPLPYNGDLSYLYNKQHIEDQLNLLESLGETYHPHGWSLMYYYEDTFGDGNGFSSSEGKLTRSSDNTVFEGAFGTESVEIENGEGITLSIGHLRKATSGCGYEDGNWPPDPHPFIWDFNGKKYAFIHNGTINKTSLRNALTDDWLSTVPPNPPQVYHCDLYPWYTPEGWINVVDSEIYFFWIMKHIIENPNGNVLAALHKALSHPDFTGMDLSAIDYASKNFILTDGETIWAYSWREHEDESALLTEYQHTLYYIDNYCDNDCIEEPPNMMSLASYKAAMSQHPGDGSLDPGVWHEMGIGELVVLNRSEPAMVYENFDEELFLTVNYIDNDCQGALNGTWNLFDSSGEIPLADNIEAGVSTQVYYGEAYKIRANEVDQTGLYKHFHWENLYEYRIDLDYVQDDFESTEITANFKEFFQPVFLTTDNVSIKIQDPWYVGNNQSGEYIDLDTWLSNSGKLFREVGEYVEGQPLLDPSYEIRVAKITTGQYGEPHNQYGIYRFTDFSFDPQEFLIPYQLDSDGYITADIWLQGDDGSELTVNYSQENELDLHTITIYPDEILFIPPGAQIKFGEWTGVDIQGEFIASSGAQDIILYSDETWYGLGLNTGCEVKLESLHIANTSVPISLIGLPQDVLIDNFSSAHNEYSTIISGNGNGIGGLEGSTNIEIRNSTFNDGLINLLLLDGNISLIGNTFVNSTLSAIYLRGDITIENNTFLGTSQSVENFDIKADGFLGGTMVIANNLCAKYSDSGVGITAGAVDTQDDFYQFFSDSYIYVIDNTIEKFSGNEYYKNGIWINGFNPDADVIVKIELYNNLLIGDDVSDNYGIVLYNRHGTNNQIDLLYDHNNFFGYSADHRYYDGWNSYPLSDNDIISNPYLIEVDYTDYYPLACSDVINAGNPDLELDPEGSISDIGAFTHLMGEVNNDGYLDVIDINTIVGVILQNPVYDDFIDDVACVGDFNNDGYVDILDAVAIVDYLLYGPQRSAPAGGNGYMSIAPNDHTLTRFDGSHFTLVSESDIPVRGLQFVLEYNNDAYSFAQAQLTDVSSGLELEFFEHDNGLIQFIIFPVDEYAIPAGVHNILDIEFNSLGRTTASAVSEIVDVIMAGSDGTNIFQGYHTGIPEIADAYELMPAYPNPFNPSTVIGYFLPESGSVTFEVFDLLGQRIDVLGEKNTAVQAGYHSIHWNAQGFASGVYIIRMLVEPHQDHKDLIIRQQKVLLIK